MNSLKGLICGFLLLFAAALPLQAQDLAQVEDGTATLLVDEVTLIGHLNVFMRVVVEVEANFTAVEIVSHGEGYVLIATGETYRIAWALEDSETGPGILRAGSLSCTTDCGAEPGVCMPNTSNMTCVPVCQTGDCSRTVSVDTDLFKY
jgi:hypothetical protein